MNKPGLAGVRFAGRGQAVFPDPMPGEPAYGNNLPPNTGAAFHPMQRGPAPASQRIDGQLGAFDGNVGNDPRADARGLQPWPKSSLTASGANSEGQPSQPAAKYTDGRPPIPYGGYGIAGRSMTDNSSRVQTGIYGDPYDPGPQPTFWRGAIQGYNDKLTVKDRHAYWDTGTQRTGLTGPAWGFPNTYNDSTVRPPVPELRTLNRTVSYQKGTDTTRNQDDLSRPYTWLGEQGSGWAPIYGGVPGLYQPYATRGGVPYPIQSPAEFGAPGDGPHLVFAGPPHGLHTQTPWKGGEQILSRTYVLPQMRPVRFDRPSNSPQAGQSYSQTVVPQGASRVRPRTPPGSPGPSGSWFGSTGQRGWVGRGRKGWIQ